ncbi:MAG: hypothetical protein ACJAR8_001073, partial [Bacteroidia bacterium]
VANTVPVVNTPSTSKIKVSIAASLSNIISK